MTAIDDSNKGGLIPVSISHGTVPAQSCPDKADGRAKPDRHLLGMVQRPPFLVKGFHGINRVGAE